MRWVLPAVGGKQSAAIAFLNRRTDGTPTKISAVLRDIGLGSTTGYQVQELFDGRTLGFYEPDDRLSVLVNPSGRNDNLVASFPDLTFPLFIDIGVVLVKCTVQGKKQTTEDDVMQTNSLY